MFPPAAGTTLRLDVPHLYLSFFGFGCFLLCFHDSSLFLGARLTQQSRRRTPAYEKLAVLTIFFMRSLGWQRIGSGGSLNRHGQLGSITPTFAIGFSWLKL
jgi:hypothetical protein